MRAGSPRQIALLAVLALGVSGCVEGQGPFAAKPKDGGEEAGAPAKPQRSTKIVERDVEAPQVFQVTDQALWDGRPSLGGVWVASPDATDPERVIMRNPANGKFVIGALFKREIDNPGPKLQISSDAAEALGLLAGAPARISVTALRREEAAEEAPAAPILDTAEALPPAGGAGTGAIDAGGVETKPLDAPASTGDKKKAPAKARETAAVAGAALDAAAPPPAAAPPAPPKATGGRVIQIGFFSVEANAKRAVDTLAKAGLAGEVRKESSSGKDYWSVIARGDAETLKKVKAAGFSDAYMLK